jgi:hypothetical protein
MPERMQFRLFEGRCVGMALIDGSRLEGCRLISAPRHGAQTMWLVTDGGDDVFIPMSSVVDIWSVAVAV